jgi:hypothetical protein
METTVLTLNEIDIESVAEGIVDLLESELPGVIEEVNAFKDDGITLNSDVTVKHDSPVSGFTILSVKDYPAIFIDPIKESERGGSTGLQFAISGWIRDTNLKQIKKKSERFALAVKATLKKDASLGGIVGGLVIAGIEYSDPFNVTSRDTQGTYATFMMDVSYYY